MKFGRGLIILCWLGLLACKSQANLNRSFLQWLSKTESFPAMEAYLYRADLPLSDSLWAWRAMLALQQNKLTEFHSIWQNGQSFLIHEPALCGRIACSLLRAETHQVENEAWFVWLKNNSQDTILLNLVAVHQGTISLGNEVLEHGQLALAWQKYKKMEQKKPGVAMGASMLLPGGGAWYANAPGRGISQTIFIGLMAMQAYESVRRLGWNHPFTWFSVPLASVFYVAGVYGGARDIIQQREALKRNFFLDVSDFYSAVYYNSFF